MKTVVLQRQGNVLHDASCVETGMKGAITVR